MAYKIPIALTLFILGLCATGRSQPGLRLSQSSDDTLIRDKTSDAKGVKPTININNYYRLYVGTAYHFTTGGHQDPSPANKHTVGLNYSITEKSFHPFYKALFPELLGGWNLSLLAGYDQVRRVNFFGVGNESPRNPFAERFNWLRTENLYAKVGVDRTFAERHHVGVNLMYDGITVMDDADRIVARSKGLVEPAQYNRQSFLGSQLSYSYIVLNRPVIPTKGIEFTSAAAYTQNLNRSSQSFARFSTELDVYLPLFKSFSFVNRSGLATVTGSPDFYQLNTLGGTNSLRGYQRFRFYGKTSFFNQTEFRWVPYIETKLYKGQLGVFALFDQGRVWHPGEVSHKMHYGYGGGLILAPFNKVAITAAYAISKEDRRMHLSVRRIF